LYCHARYCAGIAFKKENADSREPAFLLSEEFIKKFI